MEMSNSNYCNRTVVAVSGKDRLEFLQALVTNDVNRASNGLAYSALLTPQGKFLLDFFMFARDEQILFDVNADFAGEFVTRMNAYKLRSDVQIRETPIKVSGGFDNAPNGSFIDPRHPALGWRAYSETPYNIRNEPERERIRILYCIPEMPIELIPNSTYILEAGFERLNGVDFKKGCYVGQEVTARMKHKTELRKGLATVEISSEVPVGTGITCNGRPVGTVFSQSAGRAIAYLRFDRIKSAPLHAGHAVVRLRN